MEPYKVTEGDAAQRRAVRDWLFGLELVSLPLQEKIVTAWITAWVASPYVEIAEFPYSTSAPDYGLREHVNDVTRVGIELARRASADWGREMDDEILVPILILHDVDKPLMFVREGAEVQRSPLSHELLHGVVGAMILKDLGFQHLVVSTVAMHAGNAPFHAPNFEASVLHYADYFSTDHAYRLSGAQQFYQRPWR